MSTSVFLVMKNDAPDCVFSDKLLAEAYVERQKKYQAELLPPHTPPLLYYRYYELELDQAGFWDYRRGQNTYNVDPPFEKRGKRADGLDEKLT